LYNQTLRTAEVFFFDIFMKPVSPAIAAVRPRASGRGSAEHRLLEELVAELADEMPERIVRLVGPCGSGKSTALAHLAAVFADDPRFSFLDEPDLAKVAQPPNRIVVVATRTHSNPQSDDLRLDPWRLDELVEYLLAKHHAACGSVIERLDKQARRAWLPEIAACVLDLFATAPTATDVEVELSHLILRRLNLSRTPDAIGQYCVSRLTPRGDAEGERVPPIECPGHLRGLLRHSIVQVVLAADYLHAMLSAGSMKELRSAFPHALVERVGKQCRGNAVSIQTLQNAIRAQSDETREAMAASILFAANPNWRPIRNSRVSWRLADGFFPGAQWSGMSLEYAKLLHTDLSAADLSQANLRRANCYSTDFSDADLLGANLSNVEARSANFQRANLTSAILIESDVRRADFYEANFSGANLKSADLRDCDLSAANFTNANLTSSRFAGAFLTDADFSGALLFGAMLDACDLRATKLRGANLEHVSLKSAILEDVDLPLAKMAGADLQGAYLTGSKLHSADLQGANLSGAHLAEIDWEGADLRDVQLKGATFHMGSSRSGLVDSPIACEGSKTGFYTDDYEDRNYKRPEEIRKANLCGADLRGARLLDVDLYLVDLRDAQLDSAERAHARRCGAILEDVIA
jgi:uncharacterized protein YjbI with pentapeptide repeats